MRIALVTPAPAGARSGNRTTATRWAGMLRALGHTVHVTTTWDGRPADLLIALHALKSRESVQAFQRACPGRPIVVVLTGTDVYAALRESEDARDTLRQATRLVVLQPCAVDEIPEDVRGRARVIYQSAVPVDGSAPFPSFAVCVASALRPVKDPLLCARAARLLPAASRVRVEHFGAALDPTLVEEACREMSHNPRYRLRGDQPHRTVLHHLARSSLLVLTSRLEGGANVVSEALACGVPVLSTRIPGSIGILGDDYEGYFPVGDAEALAALLGRAESDPAWLVRLREQCQERRPLVDPRREREALAMLVADASRRP